ncbi:hypothetical protein HFQ13_10455 [Acidithiobacillus sp. VAN18-1]|uniref:Uncharacterized protein n=2 Tax=Igneacidithiobacillus copahuensis TaxID=2724909 RepID=A0AAE2YQV9_9PROT|nr:hypothetical protein [Igneacidithiobacillus copahuensis]MBU2796705.1 hypothetical protein [Acidithiobacillus sp. VAN18-2]
MDSAPKDGTPILAYCVHESETQIDDSGEYTTYGAHVNEFTPVPDGFHVLVWGGEYDSDDSDYEDFDLDNHFHVPNWWFRHGSDFEEVAAPVAWKPILDKQAKIPE